MLSREGIHKILSAQIAQIFLTVHLRSNGSDCAIIVYKELKPYLLPSLPRPFPPTAGCTRSAPPSPDPAPCSSTPSSSRHVLYAPHCRLPAMRGGRRLAMVGWQARDPAAADPDSAAAAMRDGLETMGDGRAARGATAGRIPATNAAPCSFSNPATGRSSAPSCLPTCSPSQISFSLYPNSSCVMHGGGEGGHESADPEQKETVTLQGHLLMVVGDSIAKVPSCFVVDVKHVT